MSLSELFVRALPESPPARDNVLNQHTQSNKHKHTDAADDGFTGFSGYS